MRAALALAVVAAGLWGAPASAAAPPATAARSVTLISGDRLQISADGRSASRLPSARDTVPLVIRFAGGRLRVVPADALPLLDAGRLDPRLFDVTGLLAAGYDGARGDLPLIVTHGDGPPGALRTAAGGGPVRELDSVRASALRVPAARTATLWSGLAGGALDRAYGKVWLDGIATLSTDVSVPLVGAPAAWAAGLTGGGVPVGVLDTGVDAGHPDLAGTVAETADFTAAGDAVDRVGHGTHVASVIAGSGAASAGRNRGMAPDVRIFSAKVCETVCQESAVLAGMQWAARDKRVRVVNLSAGRPDGPGTDLLEAAVEKLTAEYGTLFVVAAGNADGPVTSPASADAALAVGATDERDAVAPGGHGPRTGDGGLKPDMVAPGVDVTAARSGGSRLPGGAYTVRSGTSVAAPHVTGAAAILAQQRPDLPPGRLKAALMSTATALDAPVDRVGAGRLDVAKAVSSPVTASPGSVLVGDGGATVTYENAGTSAVTLALSVAADAPGDPFRLGETTVTVPARGRAAVRVAAGGGARRSTGVLTAASGDLTVRTTLGPAGGAETVALTLRWTGRDGAPARWATGTAYALDGSGATVVPGDGGSGTVRLPPGAYALDAVVFAADGAPTLLTRPRLVLDRDTTVDMDARLARPVRIAAPRAGAGQVHGQIGFTVATAGGPVVAGVRTATFDGVHTARIGPDTAPPGFRTDVAAAWAQRGADGSHHDSRYLYALSWAVPGAVTGFDRTVDPASLVAVRSSYGAAAAGTTGLLTRTPAGSAGGHTSSFGLPFTRTEYLSPGVRWDARLTETTPAGATLTVSSAVPGAARPGAEQWNTGVSGPAFPPGTGHGVRRDGDTLTVHPAWFSDAGHAGVSPAAAHRTVVTRDGTVVADAASPSAVVTVPPGEAAFTVTNESTRPAATSPRIRTTWTFRSGRTARDEAVPLAVVRFRPLPDGVLAYSVQHQAGGTTAALRLSVSYDDGKTWHRPIATRIGEHGVAFLRPPPGFVSLRVAATDSAGGTVEQTVIRAYAAD